MLLARGASIGMAIWALQTGMAAILPGLASAQAGLIAASCLVSVFCYAGLAMLPKRLGAGGIGAVAGAGTSLAHFLLLAAVLPPSAEPDPGLALVGVAIAPMTLAGLDWSGGVVAGRWGRMAAMLAALSGLALLHLAAMAALRMVVAVPLEPTSVLAPLWCGSLALLLGAQLGERSILTSRTTRAERARFRLIAEALPSPICVTNAADHSLIFTNKRAREQFGLFGEVGQGDRSDSYYAVSGAQKKVLEGVARHGAIENEEIEFRRPDGSTFWALISACSISFDGAPAILASCHDITDRKAAETALLDSEVRYALISRAANDGIWDWNIPGGAVYYSTRWKEIVGIEPGRRLSTLEDWLSRVHPEDAVRLRSEIDAHVAGRTAQLDCEYRILHGGGRYCWMHCRAIALRSSEGLPIRMAGSQSDITLRKTYEMNLLNAAYEDRLTALNNRAFFNQLAETRSGGAEIDGTAILLLNVDQFRRLNDSFGNAAGDALLIAMARRLAARVKASDAVARIGGDEFAVWVRHGTGDADTGPVDRALAEMLLAELTLPYALGDVEMAVTVSIGVATPALGNAASGVDLLRNARLALDRAKMLGGARVELFDDALLRETELLRRLSKDLTGADRQGQIFFEYQPVLALKDRVVVGFESLMRWTHPELGLILPERFIPIAEEAGLIGQLGLTAIVAAATEIAGLSRLNVLPDEFSIAVNLSNRQISDRAGVLRMLGLLDRLEIPRGRLKLEITESVLMSDPEAMARTLHEFKRRGIELALDDFGTGYSSLSYLHRFPFDVLKIDRSFVSRMLHAPEALRLVRSIIELSHDLGLRVIAEGVEAARECDLLLELGCDQAQGYFFSRPMSGPEAAGALARNGRWLNQSAHSDRALMS